MRRPLNRNWNRLSPKMSLGAKMLMAGTILGIFLGLCLGNQANKPYQSEVASEARPAPTVTVTKTTTKTVTEPVMPESCTQAVADMVAIQSEMSWFVSVAGEQTDIINATYVAILAKDNKKLIDLGNRQNDLVRKSATERRDLQDKVAQFAKDIARCQADVGDDHGKSPGR